MIPIPEPSLLQNSSCAWRMTASLRQAGPAEKLPRARFEREGSSGTAWGAIVNSVARTLLAVVEKLIGRTECWGRMLPDSDDGILSRQRSCIAPFVGKHCVRERSGAVSMASQLQEGAFSARSGK